jgi:hypothetical protein
MDEHCDYGDHAEPLLTHPAASMRIKVGSAVDTGRRIITGHAEPARFAGSGRRGAGAGARKLQFSSSVRSMNEVFPL